MVEAYRQLPKTVNNNFSYLLVALLILLFGIPLAEDLSLTSTPLARTLVFSALLAVGVWSLTGGQRYFQLGIALAVIGIGLNVAAANTDSQALTIASLCTIFLYLLVAVSYTFGQIALGTEMSFNRLVGAVCVYLLLGALWAFAYSILDIVAPGSFNNIAVSTDRGWESGWLYFSFVTMTTLGYGDISPATATARTLAYMQAVFGLFYIAILVAGLVSGYIANRQLSTED